jgi:hypothetical protein
MYWLTILHTIPKEHLTELMEYCEKARKSDASFIYEQQEDRVIITSPSKDQAYKRGALFHYKYKCYYEVVFKQSPHQCSASPHGRHEFNHETHVCIWCNKPAVEIAK